MKWTNALILVVSRPHSQPFPRPFVMKHVHIAALLMSMILSTQSLNLNRQNWGLSIDNKDSSANINLDDISPLRKNSFLEGGRRRKYRQMSIDNNIEILKAKLINSLLVRRQQNQARTSFTLYIVPSFLEQYFQLRSLSDVLVLG